MDQVAKPGDFLCQNHYSVSKRLILGKRLSPVVFIANEPIIEKTRGNKGNSGICFEIGINR